MSLQKIETALRTAYRAGGFFADENTAFENQAFEPTPGTPWAQLFLVPSQPSAASLGDSGLDEHTGFLQIDLNYPINEGTGAINIKADEIRAHFKAGARFVDDEFSQDPQSVLIRSCGRSNGRNVNGWYRVSITVFWSAWTQR